MRTAVAALSEHACPSQASEVGLGEVIKGSLSAEIGPVLIGVVSHAGSPRPESPTRQGSVAHIGREALALQQETSVEQASCSALFSSSLPCAVSSCSLSADRAALKHAHLACLKADCQLILDMLDCLSKWMHILFYTFQPSRETVPRRQRAVCHVSTVQIECMVPVPGGKR